MSQSFDDFFERATDVSPYPYQRRLAGEDSGRRCASLRIHVPTGAGKTEAVRPTAMNEDVVSHVEGTCAGDPPDGTVPREDAVTEDARRYPEKASEIVARVCGRQALVTTSEGHRVRVGTVAE